ncbi:TraR/DksA family transcriptional regulator [Cellvibrio sp. QJXJ]|uniref:TraR/DksA family transcriptional regulator n=1 Tax=Cellvibrio sp. QJXJ TaxID=2964606 RepID=UPI0021C48D7E|nr:TraR/DksA C4-type zinc finger protein [Cellvibrio sp. QJXJ]UUA72608.1 TraR/DksA C4-type zinc finger protein [Cellvibrio sp. QJXJ]
MVKKAASIAQAPLTAAKLLQMPAADYMNTAQLTFFRQLLLDLKQQTAEHIETIKQEIAAPSTEADELDRALWEEENRQRMRIAEREFFLLRKIDKALDRIEQGDYGYCEASGVEIGLARLLARPTTEFSTEEKARQEELERSFSKQRN